AAAPLHDWPRGRPDPGAARPRHGGLDPPQHGLPGSAPRPGGPGPGGRPARPEPRRACRPDPTRSRNRTMSPHPTPTHPHRARSVVLGVLLPALLVAGAALLTTTWVPRLPDPAVLHSSLP